MSAEEVFGYSLEHVENRTEKEVGAELENLLASTKITCSCQLCIEDMFMIALNLLPARYQHSATLRLVKKDPILTPSMVKGAVESAVSDVGKHPKHD